MAKSDACKDSLTHMSYDFAESQRSLTGFAGIIKQNSRGGHALPGKMSVRTGPSEGSLLQRRTDKNMGGHSVFFSKPRKFTKKSNRRMWVMQSVCTICSEWDCGIADSLSKTKAKGKWKPLIRTRGLCRRPLQASQLSPYLSCRLSLSLAYNRGSQSHIQLWKPYGSQRDWAVKIPT